MQELNLKGDDGRMKTMFRVQYCFINIFGQSGLSSHKSQKNSVKGEQKLLHNNLILGIF